MSVDKIDLPAELQRVRASFDRQLAEVLSRRPDLPHRQIAKEFGISLKVVRRVIRQFQIGGRKRGPKARPRVAVST